MNIKGETIFGKQMLKDGVSQYGEFVSERALWSEVKIDV